MGCVWSQQSHIQMAHFKGLPYLWTLMLYVLTFISQLTIRMINWFSLNSWEMGCCLGLLSSGYWLEQSRSCETIGRYWICSDSYICYGFLSTGDVPSWMTLWEEKRSCLSDLIMFLACGGADSPLSQPPGWQCALLMRRTKVKIINTHPVH